MNTSNAKKLRILAILLASLGAAIMLTNCDRIKKIGEDIGLSVEAEHSDKKSSTAAETILADATATMNGIAKSIQKKDIKSLETFAAKMKELDKTMENSDFDPSEVTDNKLTAAYFAAWEAMSQAIDTAHEKWSESDQKKLNELLDF